MIQIRPLKPEDAKHLSTMLGETWHDNFDATIGYDVVNAFVAQTYDPEKLRRQAENPNLTSLVATLEAVIIGHAMGKAEDDHLFVHRLYIHPDVQRGGLGQRLYNELLARLPTRREIRLEVIRDNPKAQAFYEKNGFAVTGEMNECHGATDIPSLEMTKVADGWRP